MSTPLNDAIRARLDDWSPMDNEEQFAAALIAVLDLDPDDVGHGLFCASHYERRPCDCWHAALTAAIASSLGLATDGDSA